MHTYDNPDLTAQEFMLEVMRDRSVNLSLRMRAADELCRAGLGDFSYPYPHLHQNIPCFVCSHIRLLLRTKNAHRGLADASYISGYDA